MRVWQTAVMAWQSIAANKLRAALTVLGILIGVGAVIAVMAVGKGSQRAVTESVQGLGTDLLFVRPGFSQSGAVRTAAGSAATLTLDDAEALADPANVPGVTHVAPETETFGQVVGGGQNVNTRVTGTTPDYQYIRNYALAEGDFITQEQLDAKSAVVVLGSTVAENLFGDQSAVGQLVRVNSIQFRVVGVLESKGGTGLGSQDDVVIAPLTTVQTRLASARTARGGQRIQTINVQVSSGKYMDAAKTGITETLRELHEITSEDDFTVTSQQDLVSAYNDVSRTFTIFLSAIAGISLLVGGIGVMNVMLVSVTERTREIGIRKAIGAKRRDILLQFLLEAGMLSALGGALGVALGFGGARAIDGITVSNQVLRTVVTLDIVVLAVAVAVVIGVFFGMYPATRAARLDPIEALRHE